MTDVQGDTGTEMKAQSLDTNAAATYTLAGKVYRATVAGLVAAVMLLLLLVVRMIIMYCPAASSPPDPTTGSSVMASATVTTREPWTPVENNERDHTGCPQNWQKHGKHCYCFFPEGKEMDWNTSRKQCTDMDSDLVVIESQEELEYLHNQSRGHYYFLGLTYSESKGTWKWINNMEYNSSMFSVEGNTTGYLCSVIGRGKVQTAPCNGSHTTQNMCKKPATLSER